MIRLPPLAATSEIALNQRTQKTIKEIYSPFIHFFDIDNWLENGGNEEEEEKYEDAMHYFRLRSRLHNMWSKNFYFSINASHVRRPSIEWISLLRPAETRIMPVAGN